MANKAKTETKSAAKPKAAAAPAKKAVEKKAAPAKPAAKAAPTKKAAGTVKGASYSCSVCGLVVSVDTACGCVDACDIVCCGKEMKVKKPKTK
jgi:hypothetical protein